MGCVGEQGTKTLALASTGCEVWHGTPQGARRHIAFSLVQRLITTTRTGLPDLRLTMKANVNLLQHIAASRPGSASSELKGPDHVPHRLRWSWHSSMPTSA